jgi:hypothetical protein
VCEVYESLITCTLWFHCDAVTPHSASHCDAVIDCSCDRIFDIDSSSVCSDSRLSSITTCAVPQQVTVSSHLEQDSSDVLDHVHRRCLQALASSTLLQAHQPRDVERTAMHLLAHSSVKLNHLLSSHQLASQRQSSVVTTRRVLFRPHTTRTNALTGCLMIALCLQSTRCVDMIAHSNSPNLSWKPFGNNSSAVIVPLPLITKKWHDWIQAEQ